MSHTHWSDEELLGLTYGARTDDGSVSQCPECHVRLAQISAARQRVVATEPEIPASLLARQRSAVVGRLAPQWSVWRLAPGLAATCLLVGALAISTPRPPRSEPVSAASMSAPANSDLQFYSEVFSEVDSSEPRAVAPVRALFEGEK